MGREYVIGMALRQIAGALLVPPAAIIFLAASGCSGGHSDSREAAQPEDRYRPSAEVLQRQDEIIEQGMELSRALAESFTVEQLRKANEATLAHEEYVKVDGTTTLKFEELTPEQQELLRQICGLQLEQFALFPAPTHPAVQRDRQAFLLLAEQSEVYAIGYIWDRGGPDWEPFLDYMGHIARRTADGELKGAGMFGGEFHGPYEPTPAMQEAGMDYRALGLAEHLEGSASQAAIDAEDAEEAEGD